MAKRIPKYLNPFIATVYFAITRLPFKIAYAAMAFVLVMANVLLVKSENIQKNIREIFPDLDEPGVKALTRKMLASFGHHIAEVFHMASFKEGTHGLRIDVTTPEGTLFEGKGPAIYVGAHVGSWELFPLVFSQKSQPLTVIYSQHGNGIVNTLLMQQRQQTGASYVEKRKSLKPCFQALDRGECIALLVDQRVNPGIDVNFFGRPTAITRMPARLATNFDCPIIPFEVVRVKRGHLRVVLQNAILPNGEKGKQAELRLTQETATAVQQSILRNAESWFCSKLRWKRVDKERIAAQELQPDESRPSVSGPSPLNQ